MPGKIPGTAKLHWSERELPTTLIVGIPALLGAAMAVGKAVAEDASGWLEGLLISATAWLFFGTLVKAYLAVHKDKSSEAKKSPTDLLGCILPFYKVLQAVRQRSGALGTGKLRVTIHRIDHLTKTVEQCVDYIGETEVARKAGRKFALSQGLVGQAARTNAPVVVEKSATSDEEHINILMKEFGYTRGEAEGLDRSRWSFMAVPILSGESPSLQTIGVVYADSTDPKFFTEEIQQLMLAATSGVAAFVRIRYPS